MIEIELLDIEGCFLIHNFLQQDDRGLFVKIYNKDDFEKFIRSFWIYRPGIC